MSDRLMDGMDDRIRTDVTFAVAGVMGGLVFGIYGGPPMITMIGSLIKGGLEAGWALHLAIAGFVGLVFGEILQALGPSESVKPVLALAYGVLWWVGGVLVAMPIIMGRPEAILDVGPAVPSLWGHLVYAAVLLSVGSLGLAVTAPSPTVSRREA
ncbi:MAG: hypothetical protein HY556_03075 [Euryarchaeota archaeon]|nr:hypothetical protein [Euryarchaeota archaeon]